MQNIDSLVEVNGDQLYARFIENYEGRPTLVFLHDSLGCVTLWKDFPYKVAEATNCNLLIYDRKGYGKSDPMESTARSNSYLEYEADTLNSLLLQLKITKAILFGHSDGGSIALITAAKYPSIVKAVISEAAHIFLEQETLDGIKVAVESYRTTNLKRRLAKYHGEKTDTIFRAWAETWLSDEYKTWNIEHFLPDIVCPTLIIQGEKDEYGTMKQVSGISDQIDGDAEIFILSGIGHTPHKEAPSEILKKVQQFIKTLLISQTSA